MVLARLVMLLAVIGSCTALRVPLTAPRGLHASRSLPRASKLSMGDEAEPEAPAPAAEPEKKASGYVRESEFLGFDTNTSDGALFASLIVSGGFCVVVEFIKFLDPNNAGDASIFGSLSTMGM